MNRLFVTLLLLASTAHGEPTFPGAQSGKMTYRGKELPLRVDLTEQLSHPIKRQRGGSCHIASAGDLFEAACFRATGKRVKLADDYSLYRHLREEGQQWGFPTEAVRENRQVTTRDGGDLSSNLRRILGGDVCTESEIGSMESFYSSVSNQFDSIAEEARYDYRKWRFLSRGLGLFAGAGLAALHAYYVERAWGPDCHKAYQQLAKQAAQIGPVLPLMALGFAGAQWQLRRHTDREASRRFLRVIDESASNLPNLTRDEKKGPVCRTQDPDLLACLQLGFKRHEAKYSEALVVEMLAAGIPVTCVGKYTGVWHSAIFVGYQPLSANPVPPDRRQKGVRFLMRNSHGRPTQAISYRDFPCETIEWLD